MTDAPNIDMQAPDMIHAAGERLLVEIDMLRDIAGTPDASSICDELRQWARARIDDRLASAAREAAAWMAGRDAAAHAAGHHNRWSHLAENIRDLSPPADLSAALDRLIAERVREAVEAEREAIAQIADEHVARYQALLDKAKLSEYMTHYGRLVDAVEGVADYIRAARGSKEGRDG